MTNASVYKANKAQKKTSKVAKPTYPELAADFIKKHKATGFFLLFCLLLALLFTLNQRLNSLVYGLLDPSFNYGVDAAAAAKLHFGTQFIATYGPLGYLVSNYLPKFVLEVNLWLLLYGLALGFGAFAFCRLYVKKYKWIAAALIIYSLAIAGIGLPGYIEWNYLSVFLLYSFVFLRSGIKTKYVIAACLAIFASIFSLTKVTLGIDGVSILFILLLFDKVDIRTKLKLISISILLFVTSFLFIGHNLGITSFSGYIKTAYLISSGFSQSMSSFTPGTALATVSVLIILLLVIVWLIYDDRKNVLRYAFLLPPMYLVWKYGVVRQDVHLLSILQFAIPLAVLIYFSRHKKAQWHIFFVSITIALSCIAVYANKLPFYGRGGLADTITSPLQNVIKGEPLKFFMVNKEKQEWTRNSVIGLKGGYLPSSWLNIIGNHKVDIYPWEADIVAANNLNWSPRPSPFSFETFEPYFDNLNAQYYSSTSSAQFIVWHNTNVGSIDGRYILWDEPKTVRMIMENYHIVSSNDAFMLLEKRTRPITINFDSFNFGEHSKLNTVYKIDYENNASLGITYLSIKLGLAEKIKTELYKQDLYYMKLTYEDGSSRTYRIVTENLSQGIIVDGMPYDWNSLLSLMATDKAIQPSELAISFEITK